MRSEGIKPTDYWVPTTQHAMLRGPSAAAMSAVAMKMLFVFLASLAPGMVMAFLGMQGIFFDPFSAFALAFFGVASVLMFTSSAMATVRRRREYRHGYTTVDFFGKYRFY